MRKPVAIALLVLGVIAVVLLGGPFLVPVPPLEGTAPPRELANADSKFIELRGIDVHYRAAGQGEPLRHPASLGAHWARTGTTRTDTGPVSR